MRIADLFNKVKNSVSTASSNLYNTYQRQSYAAEARNSAQANLRNFSNSQIENLFDTHYSASDTSAKSWVVQKVNTALSSTENYMSVQAELDAYVAAAKEEGRNYAMHQSLANTINNIVTERIEESIRLASQLENISTKNYVTLKKAEKSNEQGYVSKLARGLSYLGIVGILAGCAKAPVTQRSTPNPRPTVYVSHTTNNDVKVSQNYAIGNVAKAASDIVNYLSGKKSGPTKEELAEQRRLEALRKKYMGPIQVQVAKQTPAEENSAPKPVVKTGGGTVVGKNKQSLEDYSDGTHVVTINGDIFYPERHHFESPKTHTYSNIGPNGPLLASTNNAVAYGFPGFGQQKPAEKLYVATIEYKNERTGKFDGTRTSEFTINLDSREIVKRVDK